MTKQITPDGLLDYIRAADTPQSKKELAKAFGLKGDDRIALKEALRALMDAGKIQKTVSKDYAIASDTTIPAVAVFQVTNITDDGEVFARPEGNPDLENTLKTPILIECRGKKTCALGDRILVKLKANAKGRVTGSLMRVLGQVITKIICGRAVAITPSSRRRPGSIHPHYQEREIDPGLRRDDEKNNYPNDSIQEWLIEPVNKSDRNVYKLADGSDALKDGHLVEVVLEKEVGSSNLRPSVARLKSIIGHDDDPKAISLIAMYEKGLKAEFPDAVLAETEGLQVPPVGNREDLRKIPLVTIDGADARDFDDAVFAEPLDNGGFHIIVAIADVAHYVREGTQLAREAHYRGNSTYFPDRVVPMLPEALSNDLCSLRPKENRACMGFHLYIDDMGKLTKWKPFRGLMRSAARLTYEQVQAAFDGLTDDATDPLLDSVLTPLYDAFQILEAARSRRGALDLDMPERKILIDETGTMTGVALRERYDAHKMIEELMILANVAAAEALEAKSAPCIYRIHDQPDAAKIDNAANFLEGFGIKLAKGNVPKPDVLNGILHRVEGEDHAPLVNDVILRAQSQAVYSPDNIGHYGLALQKYAHFTSPIRRYADLIVHRSLISAYGLGDGGLTKEEAVLLGEIADQISKTERNSMEAERAAVDRFTASYLEHQRGAEYTGRIAGVTQFGLFVRLNDIGADGFIPIKHMKGDFYEHVEKAHALIGKRSGRIFRLCAPVRVMIREADRLTGSCILELVDEKAGADIAGFKGPEEMFRPTQKPSRSGRDKPHQSRKGRKDDGKRFKTGKKKKSTTPKHKRKT